MLTKSGAESMDVAFRHMLQVKLKVGITNIFSYGTLVTVKVGIVPVPDEPTKKNPPISP